MPEFRGNANNTWQFASTPQTRSRLSHATGASISLAVGVAELGAVPTRRDLLGDAIYQCVWVDAADGKISRDAFVALLDAVALQDAWRALVEAFAAEC